MPQDADRIEGNGTACLLPGLADMHVHVAEPNDASLYVLNGVTTVLHMGGVFLGGVGKIKEMANAGAFLESQMFFAFKMDNEFGFVADTPERARNAVDLAKANGYDFIKVYNNLSLPIFASVVAEAQKSGLGVVGHGVRSVGLPKALFEGQIMVAHAEEFYYTAFENQTDTKRIPQVVAEVRRSGAYVTPNLSAFEAITNQWGRPARLAEYLDDPRARFMTPAVRTHWINMDYIKREGDLTSVLPFLREFTKVLQDGGVPLVAGTDSPDIPGMFPGYSIHDDLRTLVESGLTPFQALSAATRIPGEFVAKTIPLARRFGLVAPDYRADLMMVTGDPLKDLKVLKTPLGVMHAGHGYRLARYRACS